LSISGFGGILTLPSVRFSVESGEKKKEGVSENLCLAGQKGDTPCHLEQEG
jgi:hypothetical protein